MLRYGMKQIITFISCLLLFSSLSFSQELDPGIQTDQTFLSYLRQASNQLSGSQKQLARQIPLRKINQALALTKDVIDGNVTTEKEIEATLLKARRYYKDSLIINLLLGQFYQEIGQLEKAAKYYQHFLRKADYQNQYTGGIVDSQKRAYFKQYLSGWLTQNGFSLSDDPSVDIRHRRATHRMASFENESLFVSVLITILLVGFIVLALIKAGIIPVSEKPTPLKTFLFRSYGLVVITYIIWWIQFKLGITPLKNSFEFQLGLILITGTLINLSIPLLKKQAEKAEVKKRDDLTFCPHCKKAVSKIAAVCPHCEKAI